MSIAVELPALGESVVEGTVARWLVVEGQSVGLDEPLVEITTDKADAEIPSPAEGVIEKILVEEGDTVEVGAQLAVIAAMIAPPAPAPGLRPGGAVPEPRATPVARRLAEEAHIELAEIPGSGSAGRVTKADVLERMPGTAETTAEAGTAEAAIPAEHVPGTAGRDAAVREPMPGTRDTRDPGAGSAVGASSGGAPTPSRGAQRGLPAYMSTALGEGDRVVPMSPQRKLIAEHMVYSKRTSPHVGTVAEVDLSAVTALRGRHKGAFRDAHGVSLTVLSFVVYATARALREFPALNASVIEDAIVEKRDIHIGLAVETDRGLVAPVVRFADRLSLAGLAVAIEDLSSRARARKLSADELRGGSFTISNPGRRGNLYGFAIINQPQVGILRMGELVKRPVVRTVEGVDAIAIRPMMHLALSYDHRAVDGSPANGFLYRVGELLEAGEFDL